MREKGCSRLGLALTLVLTACQGGGPGPAPAPSAPVVVIEMRNNRFVYQGPIPAGRVVFEILNRDRIDHDIRLQPLSEDVPPIYEQLRSSRRRILAPYAGVSARPPGGRGTFAVDLIEGQRYAMICYVQDETGTAHGLRGMNAEFRAVAAPA